MNIIDKLNIYKSYKAYLHAIADNAVEETLYREKLNRRIDFLTDKALHSVEIGVCEHENRQDQIVVTLTSYGKRIETVYLAVESIMQGSYLPDKIVLWLAEDEKEATSLPITLQRQMKRGLEVKYCKDIRSYKKLIPALEVYGETNLVTIDDDLIYDYNLLELLHNAHIKHPDCICAKRAHKVLHDSQGTLNNYLDWGWCKGETSPSFLNFFTTGAGTLFPPHAFGKEVTDESFMQVCSRADDVWFYCMSLLNGTRTVKVDGNKWHGQDYMEIDGTQEGSLQTQNIVRDANGACGNDMQLQAVLNLYPQIKEKMIR